MRDIPPEQQYLWIEGKISRSSFELIKDGFILEKPDEAEILFIGYAYDNVPLGKTFQVIFSKRNPAEAIFRQSKIIAVTQEFGIPLDVIPQGWKTICIVEFPQGIPDIIKNLPVINAWGENKDYVCLSDEDSWKAIR